MTEQNYYTSRLQQLGITEDFNKVGLLRYDTEAKGNVIKDEQIFRKHDKGIEIIVYNLQRETFRIEKDGSRMKKDWSIVRLEKPIIKPNGDQLKYLMPKGQGSYPFIPPELIDKFEKKTQIDDLFLTEGFFKARKGAMHGIDVIGLPSITHLKNKEKGGLHDDILQLVRTCAVKRVVWLVDGDCLDLSSKFTAEEAKGPKIDLYKRPSQFFASINTFKQMLDDYEVDKYFMHVDTDNIMQKQNFFRELDQRISRDQVKGLDDILVSFPDKINEITEDIHAVSHNGEWFQKFNITYGLSKVRDYFRLNNVNTFYLFHAERNSALKGKEFVFNGTRYRYNEEKGECDVIVPGEANKYFRVGDEYYKFIFVPNKHRQLEQRFVMRRKPTITDDHGKDFIKHISKYEAFCNVPEHVNFQQIDNNCFNVYKPLDVHSLEEECTEEDCATILGFIRHIFGTNLATFAHPTTKEKKEYAMYELGLDYIQLLFQRPTQKLPILCLVSKENNTGKSTFGKLLMQIFGGNCSIVGNQDLAGDFNAHWATKLLVICDETKIDKQTVIEKVKSLSTADKIMMNAKGKDHIELDCFIKFIFITNNEENFINLTEDDIRYWILKVPVIKEENPGMLDIMIEEIPAFLSYLNRRKLVTELLNRMWFHPMLIKTEALKKVIRYSRPVIEKELIQHLRDMFLDFGVEEIMMTRKDVHKEFFNNRYEANYVEKVLKDHLHIDQFHKLNNDELDLYQNPKKEYTTTRYTYPRWETQLRDGKTEVIRVDVSGLGRPYIFKRSQFVMPDEEVTNSDENNYVNSITPASTNGTPTNRANDLGLVF